jgi:hypothetical protein
MIFEIYQKNLEFFTPCAIYITNAIFQVYVGSPKK